MMSVDSSPSGVSPDVVFEILSNRRRRMVLYYLRQHDGTATVNELAKEIAAMENDVDIEDLTSQQQKRVYVSLYQTHLPKLESTGMIDYDTDAGRVGLTDRATEMDSYLTSTPQSTYPWEYHYAVVAVVGAATLVLALLGAPLIGAVPVYWIAISVTALFVVSAVVHYWTARRTGGQVPQEFVRRDE
jgi:hypothetical protein